MIKVKKEFQSGNGYFFKSFIMMLRKRWTPPGLQAPGILKPPGVGRYWALQWD